MEPISPTMIALTTMRNSLLLIVGHAPASRASLSRSALRWNGIAPDSQEASVGAQSQKFGRYQQDRREADVLYHHMGWGNSSLKLLRDSSSISGRSIQTGCRGERNAHWVVAAPRR